MRPVALALCLVALSAASVAPAGASPSSQAEGLAKDARRDLNRVLADARDQLAQLARLPSARSQDPASCNSDMAARGGSPRYTALGAANLQGDLYCLSIPSTTPVNITDRAYFLRALGNRGFGVGDFQVGRVTGSGALGLGYAVLVGGSPNGIVLSPLSLAWLDGRVERRAERPAIQTLVIDDHGTALAHAGRRSIEGGVNLGRLALVKAMLAERRGEGTFRLAGRRLLFAFETVAGSGGAVHVAVGVRP